MRLTHGAMSCKCQSNSDMLKGLTRSQLYSASRITPRLQNMMVGLSAGSQLSMNSLMTLCV